MTQTRPDKLIELLVQQERMVNQLAGFARQQTVLIETARTDELLTLLNSRQQIMDDFVESQAELGILTAGDFESIQATHGERELIRELVDRIAALLTQIRTQDDSDREALDRVSAPTTRPPVRTTLRRFGRNAANGGSA